MSDFTSAPQIDNSLAVGQQRMQRIEQEARDAAAAQAAAQARGAAQRDGSEEHQTANGITRETRKPFGTMEQKLYWPRRPGYHRHWFNDAPGRVEAALGAGYAHVQDSNQKPVVRVVGKRDGGGGLTAYLMEIPEEWFHEDLARAQELVDQTQKDIYRGAAGPLGQKERYVPRQGIGIKDTSR